MFGARLPEVPIADVVYYAASADTSPDLCTFAVWLWWSRVSEKSPEKDDKRKSLGVRVTTYDVFDFHFNLSYCETKPLGMQASIFGACPKPG